MGTSNIADKVVVITGASSGIGESTAKLLARQGAKVVLGARRKNRIDAVVEEISAAGGKAIGFAVDVTKRAEVEAFIKGAVDNFGRIDVIVNDAGIMLIAPIQALKVEEWERQIDVNLPFPFLHLEGLDRRDEHNTGVIHDDIDAAEIVDGSFDECFHFGALRHVDGEPDSLTACGRNLFHDCIDPVLTPGSQYDFRSLSRKKLRSALSNATAGPSDYYDLVCNI